MSSSQRSHRFSALALGVGTAILGGMLVPAAAVAAEPADVVINEAYLKGGSDGAPFTNKFIELYNAGGTAQSLDGWSLQYRSAITAGAPSVNEALSGTIDPGEYFLISWRGNGSAGAALPVTPDLAFDKTFGASGTTGTLYLADTAAPLTVPTGSVVGAADVVDLLGYGTSNTFEGAVAPVTGPNGTPNSLARSGFADTDVNAADFTHPATITPQSSAGEVPDPEPTGSPTPTPTPTETGEPVEPAVVAIADIQGTGDSSPLVGQTVTTEGVVTAAYGTGGFTGFVLQTAGTGGAIDLAAHTASDAIFVYGDAAVAADVAVGDHLSVTGAVSEYKGLTELTPAAAADVVAVPETAAAVLPATIGLPASVTDREKLESMLIAPQGAFTVSDTYDTNYYASVGLASGEGPLLTPTDVARPGTPEYDAVVADNAARAVTLDDGASINFNSAANKGIPLPYLSTTAPVRVGAPVTFTTPVILDYRNDLWNFQPTQQLTVDNAATVQPATFQNTREQSPKDVGGDIQLASFNVLNYFTTTAADVNCTATYDDRDGNPVTARDCGPRGAADDANLARQEAKIVAAINALGAEVVSLEEIENSAAFAQDRDVALSALVDALNADLGANVWAYAPSPTAVPADEDVIRTAFIYKSAAVEPIGESVILDDPAFDNARRPLAQAFVPAGGDAADAFIAIVNHFKSKGDSDPPATGDNANGVQGAFSGDRTRQAGALVDFADDMKADVGTEDVFLMGDFNAYTQEDPMQVLYEAGYVDIAPEGEYTYSFDGQVGSLDHILASADAVDLVTGSDVWNINSVESIALEYSRYNYNATNFYDESPFRSSDHDPLVVGLDLDPTVELNLLNINDFHGRIDENTVKFAGTVEQLRAEYGDENTLFLSAGDNIGASLFASSLAQDQPTIDVLNALELDAAATGNHEFDQGYEDLTDRVAKAADFPYLAANVYHRGTTDPALTEYELVEVDGLTVAVIGAITEETPTLVSPGGIADLDFGDPVEAVNRVAGELTDGDPANGEADVIVAEYHEGATESASDEPGSEHTLEDELAEGGAFASIVTDTSAAVDVIFTGHTHQQYAWDAPVPGEEGATRPVLQTGNYGEHIGQVVLEVDPDTGDVTGYTRENVTRLASEVFEDDDDATDAASAALDAELIATYPRVAEVAGIVDAALAQAEIVGAQPVGSVIADITTAFRGGSYVDGVYAGGQRDDRGAQSTLGNLVADSLRESLASAERGGAQIGVVNPGGLRDELYRAPDGVITYAEANAVLPFVNNLWTTTLTGAQFVDVLEEQWQPDGSSRTYLQLGLSENVTYTFDASAPRGERITGVWIDGEPIDPAGEYRIGSFNFLLQGGDNFGTFAEGTDTRDSGLVDRDAWIDYLGAHPDLAPSFASRSAQVTGVPAAVAAGETLAFQVSGLDLTSLGSPATTTLLASIEGSTAVFDPIPVSGGAASVSLTVPADAEGASTVVLQAPETGTDVRVPVTVTSTTVPPTLPGTGSPGTPPTTTPAPATAAELVAALKDAIHVLLGELRAGATITISVGTQYAGQWVTIWLHSSPRQLGGWQQVSAAGTVTVTLPTDLTGAHRLVVLDADGDVIGWQDVSIAAARGLAATGGQYGGVWGAALLGALLVGLGLTARMVRRRA